MCLSCVCVSDSWLFLSQNLILLILLDFIIVSASYFVVNVCFWRLCMSLKLLYFKRERAPPPITSLADGLKTYKN